MAGIKGGDDDGLLADADILIEAVFEDLAVKGEDRWEKPPEQKSLRRWPENQALPNGTT